MSVGEILVETEMFYILFYIFYFQNLSDTN